MVARLVAVGGRDLRPASGHGAIPSRRAEKRVGVVDRAHSFFGGQRGHCHDIVGFMVFDALAFL